MNTSSNKEPRVAAMIAISVACAALSPASAQVQASSYPAAQAAGNWVADVKMLSSSAKAPESDYWWVGKMWGRIEQSGRIEMRAENGCSASGILNAKSYLGLTGEVMISGCQKQQMNRRYSVVAAGGPVDGRGEAIQITFNASQNGGGSGLVDSWRVEGAFARYQPH